MTAFIRFILLLNQFNFHHLFLAWQVRNLNLNSFNMQQPVLTVNV